MILRFSIISIFLFRLSLLMAILFISTGCHPSRELLMAKGDGLLYVCPGIDGGAPLVHDAIKGFRDAGVESEIRIFDWNRTFGGLNNLIDYEGNLKRAQQTATEIASFSHDNPGQPIDIVGYSGGGGIAVLIAEALQENVRLRNLILVQAAISPEYDLTKALDQLDGEIINFYSPYDWAILGLGTNLFGTIDRENVDSAGKIGFNIDKALPSHASQSKIRQIEWNSEMIQAGHAGDHLGIFSRRWNSDYVAPYILSSQQN